MIKLIPGKYYEGRFFTYNDWDDHPTEFNYCEFSHTYEELEQTVYVFKPPQGFAWYPRFYGDTELQLMVKINQTKQLNLFE